MSAVLWIGGAQWAGKSTVAQLLSSRHPVLRYAYDYHDARSHSARAREEPERFPAFNRFLETLARNPSAVWVDATPEEMADQTRAIFAERFEMVLDDLAAIPGRPCVLAEGWGLRPELVAPLLGSPEQAVFLVPTESFRSRQQAELGRARQVNSAGLSDAERAQANRVERDRILALDVIRQAEQLGLPLVHVDGREDAAAIARRVEQQFRPFLPNWLY